MNSNLDVCTTRSVNRPLEQPAVPPLSISQQAGDLYLAPGFTANAASLQPSSSTDVSKSYSSGSSGNYFGSSSYGSGSSSSGYSSGSSSSSSSSSSSGYSTGSSSYGNEIDTGYTGGSSGTYSSDTGSYSGSGGGGGGGSEGGGASSSSYNIGSSQGYSGSNYSGSLNYTTASNKNTYSGGSVSSRSYYVPSGQVASSSGLEPLPSPTTATPPQQQQQQLQPRQHFECQSCRTAFKDGDLLRDHYFIFHPELAHECRLCLARFYHSELLYAHIRKQHISPQHTSVYRLDGHNTVASSTNYSSQRQSQFHNQTQFYTSAQVATTQVVSSARPVSSTRIVASSQQIPISAPSQHQKQQQHQGPPRAPIRQQQQASSTRLPAAVSSVTLASQLYRRPYSTPLIQSLASQFLPSASHLSSQLLRQVLTRPQQAASSFSAALLAKQKLAKAPPKKVAKPPSAPQGSGGELHKVKKRIYRKRKDFVYYPELKCQVCSVARFATWAEFEDHHRKHIGEKRLEVVILRLSQAVINVHNVALPRANPNSLKLTLRISKVGSGRGRKKKKVKIVSSGGMSYQPEVSSTPVDSDDTPATFANEAQVQSGGEEEHAGSEEAFSNEQSSVVSNEGEPADEGSNSEEASRTNETEAPVEGGEQFNENSEQDGEQYPLESTSEVEIGEGEGQQQEQQQEQEQQQQDSEDNVAGGEEGATNAAEFSGGEAPAEGSAIAKDGEGNNYAFGEATPSDAPPSSYQPQFESFSGNDEWFQDYDSAPRIAAAMAGATADGASTDAGGVWMGSGGPASAEGSSNSNSNSSSSLDREYSVSSDVPPAADQTHSTPSPETTPTSSSVIQHSRDGLFSQAVLGHDGNSSGQALDASEAEAEGERQGSFEQLCLNDSFSQDKQSSHGQQQQQSSSSGVSSDLLSELEYLNNSSSQGSGERRPSQGSSPHNSNPGTPGQASSRGSNSGTPTPSMGAQSSSPPTDTSFRALATSPLTSPTGQQSSSPHLPSGQTPPIASTSPLHQNQQSSPQPMQAQQQAHNLQLQSQDQQQGQQQQQQQSSPRITIANNLMASATATGSSTQLPMNAMMQRYGQQWQQGPGYANNTYSGLTSVSNSGPIRASLPPSVAVPYRPSPPPRVRGRPPLMGHVGRPPLHQAGLMQTGMQYQARGPGRPPSSSIMPPPLMPAPGGRGSMLPPLQRMPQQSMYGSQQGQGALGMKRGMASGTQGQSPNKQMRREDINVPSRQKDNECQIIAVANRNDGLPVISNVQGGSREGSSRGGTTQGGPTTTDSTIHLSDSITLSVRGSGANKEHGSREKGGPDAGTVANLLASRGITVTAAANGEKGDGQDGSRRIPTASELNLGSGISVHPPVNRERERDRDGFAVPQAPPSRSSNSMQQNHVERPPRPPTVDLTQDMPSSGTHSNRIQCQYCDRTFPTQALLHEHSRVHQQQQQARMPYKCHLCTAGFSTQKAQHHHYQQFHQLYMSPGDLAIPVVDLRNASNLQRMAAFGIRNFLPLSNLQNRGGGIIGVPILTLENIRNGQMNLQQWGVSDVLSLGPAKTLNLPR